MQKIRKKCRQSALIPSLDVGAAGLRRDYICCNMLHIYAPANMDACSYYHFLQMAGSDAQLEVGSGTIGFFHGQQPPNWPTPLYKWSVLLANEAAPAFHFATPVCEILGQKPWHGLRATDNAALRTFMARFGWQQPPTLWVCEATTPASEVFKCLPAAGLFARCQTLHFEETGSSHSLRLAFAQPKATAQCNPGYAQHV